MKVNKYEQFLKLRDKYELANQEIRELISDYYNTNDTFRIQHIGGAPDKKINVISLSKSDEKDQDSGEYFYWVEYYFLGKNFDKITQSEYDDIMNFIDNPEVYKKSKKFNI